MGVEHETVGTLVRHPAVVVDSEAPLREVAEILAQESIGAAIVRRTVVIDGTPRHPEGLVSERDISRAIAAGLDPDAIRAGDVMTVDLAYAKSGETILRVAKRMLANGIRHVPISDDGVIIGMVSERDVMSALVQEVHERRGK